MNLSGQVLWKRRLMVAACERATIGAASAPAPVAAAAARNLRRGSGCAVLVIVVSLNWCARYGLVLRVFLLAGRKARTLGKYVRTPIDSKNRAALLAVGLVHRAGVPPHVLAGARDAIVVRERALEHERLLDLRVHVEREPRARLPLEQARHLAFGLVLVEHLDLDAGELGRGPLHVLRFHVDRAVGRGLELHRLLAPLLDLLGGELGCHGDLLLRSTEPQNQCAYWSTPSQH